MKDFTLKAFNVQATMLPASEEKKKEAETNAAVLDQPLESLELPCDPELYFVPTFWTLVQDDTPVSQALTELALVALSETLKAKYNEKCYAQYIVGCMRNLKTHKSVKQSLSLARYILLVINAYKISPQASPIPKLLSKLNKAMNLVGLILDDFSFYLGLARAKIVPAAQLTDEEMSEQVFAGKYGHLQNLEIRFKFLEMVLSQGGEEICIGKDGLQRLWNMFVTESAVEFDMRQFFRWISAEKESGTNLLPVSVFTAEENLALFDIVCKAREPLSGRLGLAYYKCFSKHFKLVNLQAGAILVIKTKFNVKDYEKLKGLDQLWENVGHSSSDQTRIKFSELLVDAYMYPAEGIREKQATISAAFLDRCMKEIMQSDSEQVIGNLVKLLLLFTETADGSKYAEADSHSSANKFSITLLHKPSISPSIIVAWW